MREKIMEKLHSNYDLLVERGYEVVGVFLYGSQNYNLSYADSDIDCKAIVLPSFSEFLHTKKPTSTTIVLENNEQIDVKDIRLMFNSYKKQNINFIETLFTDYYVLNAKYFDLMKRLMNKREDVARYDIYKALGCISGMSGEKFKALEHPYPSIAHKIEKFGYCSKQLHHLVRLNEFIKRYVDGESYKSCLIPRDTEFLIDIKANSPYTVEEARVLAKEMDDDTRSVLNKYREENDRFVNYDVEKLMDEVMTEIFKIRFREELKE